MKDWLFEAILRLFPQMRIPDEFKEMDRRLRRHGGRVVRTEMGCYRYEFDTSEGEREFWAKTVGKHWSELLDG